MPFFYLIACILVQRLPNGVERRAAIMISSFVLFIGTLFIGPSKLFHFPDNVWMASIGQIIHGIFQVNLMVISLPEMIEATSVNYPDK